MNPSSAIDQIDWSIFTEDCRQTISLSEKIANDERSDHITEVHFIRAFYSVFTFSDYTFIKFGVSSQGVNDQVKTVEIMSKVPFRWRVAGILKHAIFLSQNFGLTYVDMPCLLRSIHDIFIDTQYHHLIEPLELDVKKLNNHIMGEGQ